jgi:hypothetical protein
MATTIRSHLLTMIVEANPLCQAVVRHPPLSND